MAKGSESKVGDGTRPKSYGHDPILSAQQGDQFAALTGNYSDPAYLTALRNRFNGDAGGYSGRNDLLQQANMAQLVGNQNAYQDQAQKASAIRDSQEARQTQQRNKGIWERAVANKIGGASADELNRSKQFQQALALRGVGQQQQGGFSNLGPLEQAKIESQQAREGNTTDQYLGNWQGDIPTDAAFLQQFAPDQEWASGWYKGSPQGNESTWANFANAQDAISVGLPPAGDPRLSDRNYANWVATLNNAWSANPNYAGG